MLPVSVIMTADYIIYSPGGGGVGLFLFQFTSKSEALLLKIRGVINQLAFGIGKRYY